MNYFNRLKNNQLINTSFYTGIATIIQTLSGIVVAKIVAVFLGPPGVAIISQFQNFISVSSSIASGGVEQGVVKYVAEYSIDEKKNNLFISTSFRFILFFSLTTGLLISIFSNKISYSLFQTNEYGMIITVFGGTVILFGLNRLLISILNGTGEIKKLVAVKIYTSLFSLIFTSSFAYFAGLKGALFALGISQSVIFFISLRFVVSSVWFKKEIISSGYNKEYIINLLKYSLMSVSSMVLVPLINIAIRNQIIEKISYDAAGFWDGLNRISTAYLGIITTTLGYYYLPKLSTLKEAGHLRKEILNGYKIILPIVVFILLIVYILKENLILVLYTADFLVMKDLFTGQLIGDFFKTASFLLSYMMLAKAKTAMFISTQIVFLLLIYILTIFMMNKWGLPGAVYAYAFNYFIYFITMFFLFRKILFPNIKI